MILKGFENAYAHELERRQDDIRDVEKLIPLRDHTKRRRSSGVPIVLLIILAWILAGFLGS